MAAKKPTKETAKKAVKKTVKKTPENRTASGRFAKGVSGNPGGRPKQSEDVVEACRAKSAEAIQVLSEIMMNKNAKDTDRIRAAEAILDRAWGKPYQAVEIDSGADTSITIKWENEEYGA